MKKKKVIAAVIATTIIMTTFAIIIKIDNYHTLNSSPSIETPDTTTLKDVDSQEDKAKELTRITGIQFNPSIAIHANLIDQYSEIDIIQLDGFGIDINRYGVNQEINQNKTLKLRIFTCLSDDQRMKGTFLVIYDQKKDPGELMVVAQYEWLKMPKWRAVDYIYTQTKELILLYNTKDKVDTLITCYKLKGKDGFVNWIEREAKSTYTENALTVNIKLPQNKWWNKEKPINFLAQHWATFSTQFFEEPLNPSILFKYKHNPSIGTKTQMKAIYTWNYGINGF